MVSEGERGERLGGGQGLTGGRGERGVGSRGRVGGWR